MNATVTITIDIDELTGQVDFLEFAQLTADDTDRDQIEGLLNMCEAIKDQIEGYPQ